MSEQRQPERPNESFEDILRRLQHQVPFESFNIVMASGDRYRIDDPFTMVISPADVFCSEPKSGMIVRLRKNQIVAVEQLLSKPAA
ncbi:MAG TPA: hypothetical protein VHQ47_00490 [Phycisphaerae bacterium]|nr:hypothetical protein [Phycisphaerae bacterium]